MPEPFRTKRRLRAQLLSVRRGLSPRRRDQASERVCEALLDLPEVAGAGTLLGFMPMGTEVAIEPVLEDVLARGATLLLPWVEGDDLQVARVTDLEGDLAPGWRAVREPRHRVPVPPEDADVAIVPGVGFDRRGTRLGYGGGHFDRLLARLRAGTPVIGPAFALQVVDRLPREPHDVPVQIIVTETGVHRVP